MHGIAISISLFALQGRDKLAMLLDVLQQSKKTGSNRTLIFCNTVTSARATQHALREANIESIAYHGEVPSEARASALSDFTQGALRFGVAIAFRCLQ